MPRVAKRHSKIEKRAEPGHKNSFRAGEDAYREASEVIYLIETVDSITVHEHITAGTKRLCQKKEEQKVKAVD